jgi:hypothetical protein
MLDVLWVLLMALLKHYQLIINQWYVCYICYVHYGDHQHILMSFVFFGLKCIQLPEERARIEAAGHTVEEMRLDGMLAVSRAFGDIPFKLPRDINFKPEDKALSPCPYVREKHIHVNTGDERLKVVTTLCFLFSSLVTTL